MLAAFTRTGFAFVLSLLLVLPAVAQDDFEYWPGTEYDPAIPTVQEVLGYEVGERITWHKDMLRYFDALAAVAPDRIVVRRHGETWEGRELIHVAISTPERIRNLDQLSANMRELADPRVTNDTRAEQLIETLPGTVWLAYSVHGNEISSTDAAMLTAYHLLAAQDDPVVEKILSETVVFLDPLQNPDGRDRFIHNFEQAEGLVPSADRLAAEHNEPWPVGRTNHYLFDMNRDWFAITQPETAARVAVLKQFLPLVFVDLHEMGSDNTYYFAPEAVPYNPNLADDQRNNLELFGRNNAQYFDQFGFDYFTREVYDAFYPGYGASWPSYYGAVAMTYEQASARGLTIRKRTGEIMDFRDTVRHHFVTSISTAEVVADNRERLLRDFYAYRETAIEEGRSGDVRSYVIPRQTDQAAADKLAGLLAYQGADIVEAGEGFRACGVEYTAGAYVIDLAQPAKRMIHNLLAENVVMNPEFIAEQERRRAKGLPDEIYDVTAWSLTHMYNLDIDACGRNLSVDGQLVEGDAFRIKPGIVTNPDATVAYLVPWNSAASARFLTQALRDGLMVKSVQKAFTLGGREYPAGTLAIKVLDNEDVQDLAQKMTALAEKTGAGVVGIDDTWVTAGPNIGSGNAVTMPQVNIAMAWDEPTSIYAPGNTRYVVERQFGYPVTPIRTNLLASADLSHYDVLILPPDGWGTYDNVLGERGAENLREWVSEGGVLVATGSAVRYLANPDYNLSGLRREDAIDPGEGNPELEEGDPTLPGLELADEEAYREQIEPEETSPDSVGGVLVYAETDPDHWLANGVKDTIIALVRGSHIYYPLDLDQGTNVAVFQDSENLLAGGYLWEENRRQLAFKPFATAEELGNGYIISFTQDPTVRAYLDGLNLILMNALFRGPANSGKLR